MMWFWLALYFALWSSIAVAIFKKVLKNTNVLVFIAYANLVSALSIGSFLLLRGFPQVDTAFWQNTVIAGLLGIVVNLSYITAIKSAPISLTAPMAASTPLVATLFGFLILSETVTTIRFLGIICIVVGAYILNIGDWKKGIFEPIRALVFNRGVQLMFVAQALVGITPVFEKTAIFHTQPREPLMAAWVGVSLMTLLFFPLAHLKIRDAFSQFKANLWWFILPAPLSLLGAWAVFTAYTLNNLGYVTAILKLSMFFTTLWGGLFFGEERIRERLLGALVMLSGTILLVV